MLFRSGEAQRFAQQTREKDEKIRQLELQNKELEENEAVYSYALGRVLAGNIDAKKSPLMRQLVIFIQQFKVSFNGVPEGLLYLGLQRLLHDEREKSR